MTGKYALIIGNVDYADPGLAQLTAPGKDAEDFARVLTDPNICGFDDVKVLLNQISSTVIEAIDEFFDQKKPDDLLILFFSGHGVRDELGSLYLAVKNTIRSRLRSTAIKSDYIREVMDQSRSRRQVLILDCCNSGAFAQGTKAVIGGTMGMVTAFQGYGRYVLTASDATQFAWEGNKVIGETDNSLFTHFLVKGLEGEADSDGDGKITVDELYDYAFEQIVNVTPKQKPNKSATKQEGEIILRQFTRLEDIKPISLPDELLEATTDSRTFVREGAVRELEKLLRGRNLGLARSARESLERIEREDDSRRVSQAATMALEPIRRAEQLALQKAEEERLVSERAAERQLAEEKVEEDRRIKEEAERLAAQLEEERRLAQQKIAEEQKAKEEADRIAQATAERERNEREIARLEAERTATEKAVQEIAPYSVTEGQTEHAAEVKNKLSQFSVSVKEKWQTLTGHVQVMPRNRSILYISSGLAVSFVVIIAFLFYQQYSEPTFYFSMNTDGATNIYFYHNDTVTKVTSTGKTVKNWSPAIDAFGDLYFTSDRTGRAEIYRIKDDGTVEQVTNTPSAAASWSPAVNGSGDVYFTSNRTGKAEIYRIKANGTVEQITNTPGEAASWSSAVSASGNLYFTSDRTGKPEIYRIETDGIVEQITNTPGGTASWAPAVSALGDLYFTSDRTGKPEIYRIYNDGKVEQITNTPGSAASWAPVLKGHNLYFTSNRDGSNSVYLLQDSKATKVIAAESWTSTLAARYPVSSRYP